ncbi:H+-or Na+-translocating f-type, v-type and A-type ATPase superfamily [Micromonas commoda]|uniref:H+-or Na+-translocating f-type, v-type and A-type ATPase superfamily n=1 Tax=Micromonas commoda (strain RCC299 / NOUM17 / CCMP2709) TaxID=296587 RepID=C1FE00_MICCC|nr:H+-or Na+-translocating f-type, v-type and A-type ATPase superfamily [Micromonas commoda]ACO68480.1 H+-or Na+-translocating f-type, v-type and A-type ATPase superfamily [Micromonas commoda]|eukprot:XP_002507222.1 H+-or Na+-translocating f-type, v-type and A-type ATPase superfamily [Micromonas commoda]
MTTISAIRCRFDTGTKFIAARRNVRARATIPKTPRAAFSSNNKSELSKVVKPTVATILTNAVIVLPSLAGEPGKIFDFNLTLPIIASEFLLLMVILDKTVFGPVGKALDDRDALIRSQLAAVGDNSTEVANLIAEKEQVISNARAEVAKEVASTKAKIDADIAEAQAKAKADVDKQIAAALAKLEAAKAESAAQVETKAKELSDQIIKKVVEV